MSTKEGRMEKSEEKKKTEERAEWHEWMHERQKNLSNYSLPLLGLSRYPHHQSYKLTISQRTSVLQPFLSLSLSSTIRFLLFVSLPYLSLLLRPSSAWTYITMFPSFPFLLRLLSSQVHGIHHQEILARLPTITSMEYKYKIHLWQ